MALLAVPCSPQPIYVKRVCPERVFSIFWTVIWRTPFIKRNKIRIYLGSNADMYEFGLSWTLRIMGRLGVFSLQSATSYAERGVGRSQATRQCWRRRGKLWSLAGRATTEHWGKVSLSCFSLKDIFPSREEICPALSLESHCLLYTCSTSHHSEITRMTTLIVLPWTEQSRFRLLCSGQTEATTPNQTQPQAERSQQEQPPAHPCTLPKAPAHCCAGAHLQSWSKPGFDTSSSHWKCQMRSRWLGWE